MTQANPTNRMILEGADSHKIAQAIYHAVTSKTEKLTRAFSENYCIKLADIEQLHTKFLQMCTQWTVLKRSENITVQHIDDNSQNFSSIERLRIYDQSQTSPVEGITFEFNILLNLPDATKPQPYKVTVRILSSIAMMKRIEQDMPPPGFLRFFRAGAIVVEIEYVDYVVARNIMSTVDSWVNEIQISSSGKMLRKFQRYSHWIPRLSGALLMIISAITAFYLTGSMLEVHSGDQMLAKFLIATFAFVTTSLFAGSWLGRLAEWAIDQIQELSYIELNLGDKRLLGDFRSKNKKYYIGVVISFLLITIHAVSCGVIGAYVYEKLFH